MEITQWTSTKPFGPSVVIVGGGFAGVQAAKGLRRTPVSVYLVDRHNYHCFQPLLYQVATAALSPADIAYPIRRIFRSQKNVSVAMAEVIGIDTERNLLRFRMGEVPFDYLILASGATHSYFGKEEWQRDAPGLKTVDDATEIRRRILLAFEEAELESDTEARRAKLTFVVIGGGPTGVELAGAIKEIAARSIPQDFRHIDTTTARVILIEASSRLLAAMPEPLSIQAKKDLEGMGVEVRLHQRVTEVNAEGVMVGEEWLPTANVFWAAGVQASPLGKMLGTELDRSGRVIVQPDLTIPGHSNIFVAGDLAHIIDPRTEHPVPGVAPAAMQMGQYVARIIHDEIVKQVPAEKRPPFRYFDKGTMATIGRAKAVASIGGRTFTGLVAWLLWSFVHVLFLIGFRNKAFVVLSWIWNYLVFAKGARLITGAAQPLRIKVPRTVGALPADGSSTEDLRET